MSDDVSNMARVMAFRAWFGLHPVQAQTVATLYAAAPRFLTAEQLAVCASSNRASIRSLMPAIREAMATEAIESAPGVGYRMTELGQAECRAVLWALGEELRGAA